MTDNLIARVQALRDLSTPQVPSASMRSRRYVTPAQLTAALAPINQRIKLMEASQQSNVDADAAAVQGIDQKLVTVQSEIDALKAQPGAASLDFSALDAAVASTGAQADTDVADAAPAAPAPDPNAPTS